MSVTATLVRSKEGKSVFTLVPPPFEMVYNDEKEFVGYMAVLLKQQRLGELVLMPLMRPYTCEEKVVMEIVTKRFGTYLETMYRKCDGKTLAAETLVSESGNQKINMDAIGMFHIEGACRLAIRQIISDFEKMSPEDQIAIGIGNHTRGCAVKICKDLLIKSVLGDLLK